MANLEPSDKELLKTVLEPLLDDFQYWFTRSITLLEKQSLPFFSAEEQNELLHRVQQAQQEVSTVQMLFKATGGQAGVDTGILMVWHQLVAQCWQISARWRSLQQEQG